MSSTKRGFTLIELLVVIAIIGLLSSIVFASLSTARTRGRIAAAQSTMRGLLPAFEACSFDGVAISIPAALAPATVSEAIDNYKVPVCAGSAAHYPSLPPSWVYCDSDAATGCIKASTQETGTVYSLSAFGDGKTITCSTNGCTTQ